MKLVVVELPEDTYAFVLNRTLNAGLGVTTAGTEPTYHGYDRYDEIDESATVAAQLRRMAEASLL